MPKAHMNFSKEELHWIRNEDKISPEIYFKKFRSGAHKSHEEHQRYSRLLGIGGFTEEELGKLRNAFESWKINKAAQFWMDRSSRDSQIRTAAVLVKGSEAFASGSINRNKWDELDAQDEEQVSRKRPQEILRNSNKLSKSQRSDAEAGLKENKYVGHSDTYTEVDGSSPQIDEQIPSSDTAATTTTVPTKLDKVMIASTAAPRTKCNTMFYHISQPVDCLFYEPTVLMKSAKPYNGHKLTAS
ncbi:hypothetical protein BCR41DRAFT_383521 [Lobosporangium transversale]|uniref:Uncharacterized protein n=1 Tax=Lobosporangium transversale TaxID=64571 RepID=A0A1Y2GZU1_9FUNG|nr:hypothetical protein BCR41DRAFT_383521 [Lobosporangium transversale]ORZ27817.1 hypothetical protein BCR41DRAFT_383521 [Lobosporangium transversale]|eukprot:XP_021885520.1 hypothetical protein BCR41DRAFT_383521 [Lobosporangium transversale]